MLIWQPEEGALPVRRLPFWREALKLFADHPLWERFPQRGYADLQFWGLGTDAALDAARLGEVVPAITGVRPILRRLDAREFHVTEYLLEAEVGAGRLLACTLRLAGGAGAQPSGWSMVARRMGAIHRPDSGVVAVADKAGTSCAARCAWRAAQRSCTLV